MKLTRLLFLVCLVTSCISITSEAFARVDYCPNNHVETQLLSKRKKTKFLRASIADINDYLNNHDQAEGTVLAFVEYGGPDSLSVETQYKFSYQNVGQGRVCVNLDKVRAYFYAAPSIVMPKDYKKGSCEYNLILKHEKRHLQTLYDFHQRNTQKYAAYLGRIAQHVPVGKPVITQDEVDAVRNQIMKYFADKFYEQVNKSLIELQAAQHKVDSPQEYYGVGLKIQKCAINRKRDSSGKTRRTFDR